MTENKIDAPVLGPNSNVLQALRRGKFTGLKNLRKPDGQEFRTRLVEEGAGMVGLENRTENQEWAGIFNHYVKTAGASLQLGKLLQLNGQNVDLQLMLDTVMLSHSGRRQYDEATWYPKDVSEAARKKEIGDAQIGLANLQDSNLPPELIDTVAVHGSPSKLKSTKTWNERLPMYLDFRIAQNAMSMEQRFKELQIGVEKGRYTQEFLDELHEWAKNTEQELFEALRLPSYDSIVFNAQNLKSRIDTAIKLGKFSQEERSMLRSTRLFKPKSGRDGVIPELLGLTEEEFVERLQLKPDDINDKLLQPERWERYIRRLYINDAEQGIFTRLSKLHRDVEKGKMGSEEELEKEFPLDTWWGKYARELYERRHGIPLHPRRHKQMGIARAIEFYRQIEDKP